MADLEKLQFLLKNHNTKLAERKAQQKAESVAAVMQTKPTQACVPVAAQKSIQQGFIETPSAPYVRPEPKEKRKTSAIGPMPAPIVALSRATTALHTSDFGFDIEGNPCITPVYCSQGAQQARRTKLFLRWKGIPGCDALIEKQFKEMLNPHPEGILTVGTYGQAGAKLWKDPESLGDEWDRCALRLKRKGAAGFMRAIADPECKIVVDNAGTTEHCYLFKLGRMVHK